MTFLVYKITNVVTGMIYVGQTSQALRTRWLEHLADSRGGCKCRRITNAIRRHGPECFTIEEVEVCNSRAHLNEREVFWIRTLGTMSPNGYNLRSGGKAGNLSQETKRLMSVSKMGDKNPSRLYPYNEERRKRQSEQMRGELNFRFGKKHTPEAIAKIKATRTPEFRKRASERLKLRWQQMRANGEDMFTPEVRQKISDAMKGRKFSDQHYQRLCAKNRARGKNRPSDDLQPSLL